MSTDEILTFANMIAAIPGITDLSQEIVNEFWILTQEFGLAQVQQALQAHRRDPGKGCYPLKPADIRRVLVGSLEMQALQAWTKVQKAITKIGSYTSVVFDDALIHAVIDDMGGWVNLCAGDRRQLSFTAREFQKRYQGFLQQVPAHYPSRLSGRMGRDMYIDNKTHTLVLIGDPNKARQVMANGGRSSLSVQAFPQDSLIPTQTKTLPAKKAVSSVAVGH